MSDKIKEFLCNFSITRPGIYTVPEFVYMAAYESFLKGGGLEPLNCFERVTYTTWHIEREDQVWYTKEEIDYLQKFINGQSFWNPEEILTHGEIESLREHVKNEAARLEYRESYLARRQQADLAIRSPKVRKEVFERDGFKCVYCSSVIDLSIDHKTSVKNGGGDTMDNFQTLCRICNSSKGDKNAVV